MHSLFLENQNNPAGFFLNLFSCTLLRVVCRNSASCMIEHGSGIVILEAGGWHIMSAGATGRGLKAHYFPSYV